jgi:replicative DNA helicase
MTRSADISPLAVLLSRVDAVADGSPQADTLRSGFPSLDKMLGGGIRRGDLVALGGDIGSGKSSLALACAIRASQAGHRIAYLTGEMAIERVLERIIALEARVQVDDLRRGGLDEVARANAGAIAVRLRETMPVIDRLPLHAQDPVAALEEVIDGLPGLEMVVVDSLQGLAPGSRDEELANTARHLKHLALSRNVAVVATAQLPHLVARPDRRPTLDDFGALGAVKQHADVVLAIFREEMYETARDIQGATELMLLKNRNGATGYVDLYFYSKWMRFEDMLDPDR